MPVNTKLMAALKKEYGDGEGRLIYYKMESEGHPSTKPAAVRKAHQKRKR